jgi:hypothetical protein
VTKLLGTSTASRKEIVAFLKDPKPGTQRALRKAVRTQISRSYSHKNDRSIRDSLLDVVDQAGN